MRVHVMSDAAEAVEALLSTLQHSGGLEKLARHRGRHLGVFHFKGRHGSRVRHTAEVLGEHHTGLSRNRDTAHVLAQMKW